MVKVVKDGAGWHVLSERYAPAMESGNSCQSGPGIAGILPLAPSDPRILGSSDLGISDPGILDPRSWHPGPLRTLQVPSRTPSQIPPDPSRTPPGPLPDPSQTSLGSRRPPWIRPLDLSDHLSIRGSVVADADVDSPSSPTSVVDPVVVFVVDVVVPRL